MTDAYRFALPTRSPEELLFLSDLETIARNSRTSYVEKFMNAGAWMPRQQLARLLAQWHAYSLTKDIHGSIVDCGVAFGAGTIAFANFVAIAEPYSHSKRVIGFDTFQGFPDMASEDARAESGLAYAGGMAITLEDEIRQLAALHDHNRPVGHIPRVEIVAGDACETIPQYVAENKHLIVSLLSLDFDVYKPTRIALEQFLPLMPKGAVVLLDEANCKDWPGESVAIKEAGLLARGRLQRSPYTSTTSYMVLD